MYLSNKLLNNNIKIIIIITTILKHQHACYYECGTEPQVP
jgi:hypothetical protein